MKLHRAIKKAQLLADITQRTYLVCKSAENGSFMIIPTGHTHRGLIDVKKVIYPNFKESK